MGETVVRQDDVQMNLFDHRSRVFRLRRHQDGEPSLGKIRGDHGASFGVRIDEEEAGDPRAFGHHAAVSGDEMNAQGKKGKKILNGRSPKSRGDRRRRGKISGLWRPPLSELGGMASNYTLSFGRVKIFLST